MLPSPINSQYTDQINSNRPGASVGAFSVGKNVIQSELGFSLENLLIVDITTLLLMGGLAFFH